METNKTIFLSLSSQAVVRNFFLFKDSVFFKLKRIPNLKIVVLVTAKDAGKFEKFFGDGLNSKYLIEPVRVPLPKGILEKAFYFFYSYLLYTGTTKVLATMALRPDEPPAGGSKFLAPIKWFISITFGKSKLVKRTLVPFIFLKIFKNRPFKEIFDKYQPDLVFSSHLYGWFDHHLLAEARRRKIRSTGMAAGWDHLDKYYLPFHVDHLLAQSNEIKKSAIKYQDYNDFKINLTGYPYFDFISDQRIAISKSEVHAKLNIPNNSKYVLYVSGSVYCPDEPEIIEKMIDWVESGELGHDVYFVLKPYIGGRGKDKAFDEEKFNRFFRHPRFRVFEATLWSDEASSIEFINIIRHADVVLGVYTTIILEASVLDRPLLAAAFDGTKIRPISRSIKRFEQFEHFKDVLKTGALATAYNFSDLKKLLRKYLDDPSYLSKERQDMREELCFKIDGKSSQRIVDFILKDLHIK